MMLTLLLAQGILDSGAAWQHRMRASARFCEMRRSVRGNQVGPTRKGKMSGRSLPEYRKTYKNRRTISGENARRFFCPFYPLSRQRLTA
jgi:hypothetical protein